MNKGGPSSKIYKFRQKQFSGEQPSRICFKNGHITCPFNRSLPGYFDRVRIAKFRFTERISGNLITLIYEKIYVSKMKELIQEFKTKQISLIK